MFLQSDIRWDVAVEGRLPSRIRWKERLIAAVISLVFAYLFFIEYLPPVQRVHMYSDIEGYHYPLLHYAFITLQHGHLPEWDPTIYCGLSLIGNVQAVRYFITKKGQPTFNTMAGNRDFRLMQPWDEGNYAAFEYLKAESPYGIDTAFGRDATGVEKVEWLPGRRAFHVKSDSGGRFILAEQFFPGWHATVDGQAVPIERWDQTFQMIRLSPGTHRVVFEFRPKSLRLGVIISIAAFALLLIFLNQ